MHDDDDVVRFWFNRKGMCSEPSILCLTSSN